MMDAIRLALQQICDDEGDGWSVAHYAIAVGLERVTGDELESLCFTHSPDGQPEYISRGLLLTAYAQALHVDEDG